MFDILLTILPMLIQIVFASNTAYAFEILQYDVSFDIKSNRTMRVIEDIEILYLGQYSTGIVRTIPIHSGDRARNIDVKLKKGDQLLNYPYKIKFTVNDNSDKYFSLYITDGIKKQNQTQTIHISYNYFITKPHNPNAIFLNVIGFGWNANIDNANVFLQLPNGYKNSNFFIGRTSNPSNNQYLYNQLKRAITANVKNLSKFNGLTFDLYFDDGILSIYHDLTPILITIMSLIILSIIFIIKYLFFDKNILIPMMNFRISKYIDPLYFGMIINDKINETDVTLLIYYWANLDYISITFIDEKESLLIKICNQLPERAPEYQKILFNSIFENGDEVNVSSLDTKIYQTIKKVVNDVNDAGIQFMLYTTNSLLVSFLFAFLGGFLMSIFPYVSCKLNITSKLNYYYGFLFLIPSFILWFIEIIYADYKLKQKSSEKKYFEKLIIIFSVIVIIIYTFYIYDEIIEKFSKIILCVFSHVIIFFSIEIICPTDKYCNLLNEIIGLKNFIYETSKEKLKLLLIDNPQLYYTIFPYAEILGMSNIWKMKFDDLTIDPPLRMVISKNSYFESTEYETRNENISDIYANSLIYDTYITNSKRSMNNYFNSRPQIAYHSINCQKSRTDDDYACNTSNYNNNYCSGSYSSSGGCNYCSGGYSSGGGCNYGSGGCGGGGNGGGGGDGI